ncbi:MAG: hypothetical protein ACE5Q6_24535 [Dehalococcoidia bacterium]
MIHTISNMNSYQATGQNISRDQDRMATTGLTFRAQNGYVIMAGVRDPERWRALWQSPLTPANAMGIEWDFPHLTEPLPAKNAATSKIPLTLPS